MKTFYYDGTFRGYLTLVCILIAENCRDVLICKSNAEQPDLFNPETGTIAYDREKYELIVNWIRARISAEVLNIIKSAFLSEAPGIEQALYLFIKMGLETGPGIINRIDHDQIHHVIKASRKTFQEVNKYMGIIRFADHGDGIKYACIEPDTNLLPLVAAHFKARFPDEMWIIHDTKRDLILLHKAGCLELIAGNEIDAAEDSPGGIASADPYAGLWKKYFGTMGIETRKNSKLQKHFLPVKRRKYVLELND